MRPPLAKYLTVGLRQIHIDFIRFDEIRSEWCWWWQQRRQRLRKKKNKMIYNFRKKSSILSTETDQNVLRRKNQINLTFVYQFAMQVYVWFDFPIWFASYLLLMLLCLTFTLYIPFYLNCSIADGIDIFFRSLFLSLLYHQPDSYEWIAFSFRTIMMMMNKKTTHTHIHHKTAVSAVKLLFQLVRKRQKYSTNWISIVANYRSRSFDLELTSKLSDWNSYTELV